MKVCLVSEYFYPQSSGGTEKYIYELAKKFKLAQVDVEIITVAAQAYTYEYEGIPVAALALNKEMSADVISGSSPAENLVAFERLITLKHYDVIHFHTLTSAFNLHHIKLARRLAKTIHFTAHIPAVTCIHGDLMQFGKVPCDGLVINHRCTACYLSKKPLPIPIGKLMAHVIAVTAFPRAIANVASNKKHELSMLNELCDKIYVFTKWQQRIFLANGFNEKKLEVTSQLIDRELQPNLSRQQKAIKKLGFVGRLTKEKGLHILIQSFIASNRADLYLEIAGIINDENAHYLKELKKLSENRTNIHWNFNLTQVEIQEFYKRVDVLCIPSIGYETGPFVLYEALSNDLPVLANSLGDMDVWRDRGFDVRTYHHKRELTQLINQL
jgi:glycosyltransferase involved in cell wall biosynthesis